MRHHLWVPEVFHGNKGSTERTPGFGLKFDAFVTDPGLFAGLAANYAWAKYSLRRADASISLNGNHARLPIAVAQIYGALI